MGLAVISYKSASYPFGLLQCSVSADYRALKKHHVETRTPQGNSTNQEKLLPIALNSQSVVAVCWHSRNKSLQWSIIWQRGVINAVRKHNCTTVRYHENQMQMLAKRALPSLFKLCCTPMYSCTHVPYETEEDPGLPPLLLNCPQTGALTFGDGVRLHLDS